MVEYIKKEDAIAAVKSWASEHVVIEAIKRIPAAVIRKHITEPAMIADGRCDFYE